MFTLCTIYFLYKTPILFIIFSRKKTKKTVAKEAKIDVKTEQENNISQKLRGQSSLLWKVIDNLKKQDLKKPELVQILEENNQTVPKGIDKVRLLFLFLL